LADFEGAAGASARRQYERRRARDEARLRQDWGRLGGLAVALTPERQSTRAWSTGAAGEERVARELDRVASAHVRVAHDRRIAGTRANIDHLVVTRDGVWVIDAKKYKGRPTLRVDGGVIRPRIERLFVGSRDQTKLVDGVVWQMEKVEAVVDAPVLGALCFVEADWPVFGGSFSVCGVEVLWPRKIASRVSSTVAGGVDVDRTWATLLAAFPAA
jgi:hypothetical protein